METIFTLACGMVIFLAGFLSGAKVEFLRQQDAADEEDS